MVRFLLCPCPRLFIKDIKEMTGTLASAQTSVIMRTTMTGGEETPNIVLSGAVGTAEIAVDPVNQEITV